MSRDEIKALLAQAEASVLDLEGPCDGCGEQYPPWVAPNHVWHYVMSKGEDASHEQPGMMCPLCFTKIADLVYEDMIWKLEPRA